VIAVNIIMRQLLIYKLGFMQPLIFLTESGYALSPMFTGFYIARFGIRNIWPVVSLIAGGAAVLIILLQFYDKRRLKKA